MNKPNITGREQVLTEISKTRKVFTELDDFFCKADENIANDPDDPREGIGRFPGLDRLMFIIPCVINRLEEDISKSKEGEDFSPITEGLPPSYSQPDNRQFNADNSKEYIKVN